ncbi:MAG: hypothetical protein E5W97_21575 [Mesorhizobium sp.]|nr:MAG: hypothetical protein E5W97_21575 [Mesorhizobium sp.]
MDNPHSHSAGNEGPASRIPVSQIRQARSMFGAAMVLIDEAHRLLGSTDSQESFDDRYIAYLEGYILGSKPNQPVELVNKSDSLPRNWDGGEDEQIVLVER